eukprot:4540856-Lingulodinium_polyedra.AAC.1
MRRLEVPADRPRGPGTVARYRVAGGAPRPPPVDAPPRVARQREPARGNIWAEMRRGDLCPAHVPAISLPAEGASPVPLTSLSPRAARVLHDFEKYMIRPDAEERFAESDIVPYVDGALRSRRSR